jgi:hypothetical protein
MGDAAMKDLIEGLRAVGLTVLTEEDLPLPLPEEDQTWRDDFTKRQADGERFDGYIEQVNLWLVGQTWDFSNRVFKKENFRVHSCRDQLKTETWYMVMVRYRDGRMWSYVTQDKAQIFADAVTWPYEIIGDVVEREVRCG